MSFRNFLTCFLGLLNAACTINSVDLLPAGGLASGNRAVIVYGVKVEGAWPYTGFHVQIAEYDVVKQNITGNCFRFNRAEASVSPVPGAVRYFAFDVPAGHYEYGPFNGAPFAGAPSAFEAPAGRSVYLGDFIFERSQSVSLTRKLDTARDDINTALPGLKGKIGLAKAAPATKPFPFLCAP